MSDGTFYPLHTFYFTLTLSVPGEKPQNTGAFFKNKK